MRRPWPAGPLLLVLLGGCPSDPQVVRPPDRGPRADWYAWIDLRRPALPDVRGLDGVQRDALWDQRASDLKGGDLPPCASCKATQLCVNNQCANKCTPQGPCLVDSGCATGELCIEVTGMGASVCIKATSTEGGPCDVNTLWCPNHLVCVTPTGQSSGFCERQCSIPGGTCSNGGLCEQATDGCTYCTPP